MLDSPKGEIVYFVTVQRLHYIGGIGGISLCGRQEETHRPRNSARWDDVSRAEVMVLGAGRGPLVEAAVKAAEKAEAVAEHCLREMSPCRGHEVGRCR